MKHPFSYIKSLRKGSSPAFEEGRSALKRTFRGQNLQEKAFFIPKMGFLRAKEVFSHGFYTTYWDENAKMMAKQEQYTCLRDANHREFEPMWNRREGKIAEK